MTSDCHKSVLSAVSVLLQPMTLFQIQFLNAVGDLLDLIPSLSHTKNSSLKVFKIWEMGHCSALIKVRHTAAFHLFLVRIHTEFFYTSPKYGNLLSPLPLAIDQLMGPSIINIKNWEKLIKRLRSCQYFNCLIYQFKLLFWY